MPDVRSTAEVFEDLRDLCREPGFLHAISFIICRDASLAVDVEGNIRRYSADRPARSELNHNEIMLLAGLLVQSDHTRVFEQVGDTDALVARADNLLESSILYWRPR